MINDKFSHQKNEQNILLTKSAMHSLLESFLYTFLQFVWMVLLLKEVERLAFKEKGIVSQSVKEVLQSLVDDDMVNSDKIGSSVYFWAFPSNSLVMKKKKLNELTNQTKLTVRTFGEETNSIRANGWRRKDRQTWKSK